MNQKDYLCEPRCVARQWQIDRYYPLAITEAIEAVHRRDHHADVVKETEE